MTQLECCPKKVRKEVKLQKIVFKKIRDKE